MEAVRSWVKQADIDDGVEQGVASDSAAEIRRLEKELREMKRANEILKRAASFFGAEPDRQQRLWLISSTAKSDDVVEGRKLGVELICKTLQMAPSTYYATRDRAPSARTLSDAALSGELYSLWENNRKVYGVRELWKAARRSGIDIGRDQTARLMRSLGIEGVKRSKRVKTTRPDPTAARHPDLVKRVFSSTAPNQLWVTDLTFVSTWVGVAYVCFIIDAYSRMIVGWRVASHMKTETVLDAIEMARWSRGKKLPGLRCRSDAGSQFTSIRYGERLAEIGAVPSGVVNVLVTSDV